jgi:Xaa-Pro aminopeptidase
MGMDELPASIFEPLRSHCLKLEFHDITAPLAKLRMLKDEEEISLLRKARGLCDLGQELVKLRAVRHHRNRAFR